MLSSILKKFLKFKKCYLNNFLSFSFVLFGLDTFTGGESQNSPSKSNERSILSSVFFSASSTPSFVLEIGTFNFLGDTFTVFGTATKI